MDFLDAFFLGILQGITEFLPVSSSGHLVIFQRLLGIDEHSLTFDIAVHLGTLASVITIYFKFLRQTFTNGLQALRQKTMNPDLKLIAMVTLATIPTGIIGLSFKDYFEALFSNLLAVGSCLLVTGVLLLFTRGKSLEKNEDGFFKFSVQDISFITWQHALILGVAQSIAIAPGISRAGTTIAVGILLGWPRHVAAMFSFMLAIPAILGAGVLQLKDITELGSEQFATMGFGFVVSYLAGLVGLWGVLHVVKKGRLEYFTVYLWIVGALTIYWSMQA